MRIQICGRTDVSTGSSRELRRIYINGKFHEEFVFDAFRMFQKHVGRELVGDIDSVGPSLTLTCWQNGQDEHCPPPGGCIPGGIIRLFRFATSGDENSTMAMVRIALPPRPLR